ncbi:MAG: aspartate aminotransferase family protein [Flavobacteriales bacterium]|nr:aspartate aminotransferase family protein [Flavobacteriales bacterium]
MSKAEDFFKEHLAQTTQESFGIKVSHAEGSYIYGVNGDKYLDLISGIGVSALGHSHPRIKERLKKQIDKHLHVMVYGEMIQDAQEDLASELLKCLPKSLNSYYFVNSGTEANEAALKLAKRATGRTKIISFKGSYHGSTHGSLSVSYGDERKRAFRPLLPGVEFIDLNKHDQLDQIDEHTAAVILETIQGDAGVRIAEDSYLKALRKICTDVGALLILDEIQCGMGRSGKMWAFEYSGIAPDILTMGKALGAGMPIGAFASSKELMSLFSHSPSLGHITTFGGHPLVCAAAAEGLKVIREEKLLDEVDAKADRFKKLLKHQKIKEVRNRGLMFAIELENKEQVQEVVLGGLNKGLLLFWFLSTPYAFRLAPPLNISNEDIELACSTILELLDELS